MTLVKDGKADFIQGAYAIHEGLPWRALWWGGRLDSTLRTRKSGNSQPRKDSGRADGTGLLLKVGHGDQASPGVGGGGAERD